MNLKLILILTTCLICYKSKAETILVNYETHFKKTAEQSSLLPDADKCLVPAGTLVSVESIELSSIHYKVTTDNNLSNCGFLTGYFYQPHIDRESKLITLTAHTVFKKHRVDSSQLPSSEKCDVAPSVLTAQDDIPQVDAGHYYLNLKELLPNCGFSQGYFWQGHATSGALAVPITYDTVFKKEPKQSSQLPATDQCEMPVAYYVLGADAVEADATHYKVTLTESLNSCGFTSGYVYFGHTGWKQPVTAPAEPEWTFPVPGGYYTSGWCICRNIGTSPHIGQDISKSGYKDAVAVQDGVLQSTTYSASCGYISYVEDDFGTLWRYVHLNQPAVSAGSRVNAGQHLGVLSSYPKSGCGNGAHLHFERRSAGYFQDSLVGKSCQNGYRSCYYDPIKPWRATSNANQVSATNSTMTANWSNFRPINTKQCKVPVKDLSTISRDRLSQFATESDQDLVVQFSILPRAESPSLFDSEIYLANNPENLCDESKRCLVQWELVSESVDSKLTSVFFQNRIRNVPVRREAKEKHCLPENAVKHWLLLKDNFGKRWKVDLTHH